VYARVDDDVSDGGPLAGLAAGLAAIARTDPAGRVAVAACDYPFADPSFFRALAAAQPGAELVVPRWDGHLHPLLALWSAGLAETCRRVLGSGERRVRAALEAAGACIVEGEALRPAIDPDRALLNVNDPESLARALALEEKEEA
jgi:molybdopterin-guanine dinucleotide biosynthesis protein A